MASKVKKEKKSDYIAKRHEVVEEIYRHYLDFQDFYMRTGQHTIEAYGLTISFLDLKDKLHKLSPRKREAFMYNVIYDMKQADVAKAMGGISEVTIGQYCQMAARQIALEYFSEFSEEEFPMDKPKKS